MNMEHAFDFVVGEEKKLAEIIRHTDVMPLIRGALRAGAGEVAVLDDQGVVLWRDGDNIGSGIESTIIFLPIRLEGETAGHLHLAGNSLSQDHLQGLAGLILDALNIIIRNNLKRMLTTEIHTAVVNQSYDDLLEMNGKLTVSERKYRELAENLEIKVEERTAELKKAHARLLQQEKMASIGQLAAGVAHEINNPMGFISSNLQTMGKYASRFIDMLSHLRSAIGETGSTTAIDSAAKKWRDLKMDLICSDVPELINQSLEGAERVKKIVSDLKAFSHVDDREECPLNLNGEIDKTLNVLSHEIGNGTQIIKNYGNLPNFVCNPALVCQVFLNLILNAIQARRDGLRLVIDTGVNEETITLSFSDNGPGIPEAIRHRIFEPFYTTKGVGAGTGMGLTVAYDIISAYGGTIELNCPEEGGARFLLLLPLRRAD